MLAFTHSNALVLRSPHVSRPSTCRHRLTSRATAISQHARASLSASDAEAPKAASAEMVAQGVSRARQIDENGTGVPLKDEEHIAPIRAQMEFWFSASNLRRDWYLRRQMDEDGWLDPAVFLLFNRVKQLNASLDDIIRACGTSEMLEVSQPAMDGSSFGDAAGQTRIRRNPTLPDFKERDTEEYRRSFILTNLPSDCNVEKVQEMFNPIASLSYVRVYRHKDFPDSPRALICFEDLETADQVFEQFETHPPEGSEGMSLRRRKNPFASDQQSQASEGRPKSIVCELTGLTQTVEWKTLYGTLSDIFTDGTNQRLRYLLYTNGESSCFITLPDNEDTRSFVSKLCDDGIEIASMQLDIRLLEKEEELKAYWDTANEQPSNRLPKRTLVDSTTGEVSKIVEGVIVKIEGLSEQVTWQSIKSAIQPHAAIVFLHHERGAPKCFVRFRTPEEATCVRDAFSAPDSQISGQPVFASILEGDEEIDYWQRANEMQKERRNKGRREIRE